VLRASRIGADPGPASLVDLAAKVAISDVSEASGRFTVRTSCQTSGKKVCDQ